MFMYFMDTVFQKSQQTTSKNYRILPSITVAAIKEVHTFKKDQFQLLLIWMDL